MKHSGKSQSRSLMKIAGVAIVALTAIASCGNGASNAGDGSTSSAAQNSTSPTTGAGDSDSPSEDQATGSSSAAEPGDFSAVDPITLTYSSFLSDQDATSKAMQWWMEQVTERTEGKVTFEEFYNGTIAKAPDALDAVVEKRADIAITGGFYFQNEWPLTTVVELPLVTFNTEAQSLALLDIYDSNPDYKAEFTNSGVHLLWPGVLSTAIMGTNKPVESIFDVKGLTMRSGGLSGKLLSDVGVNVVEIPSTDIYQSMKTGLIEGWASIVLAQVTQFGLDEVTKYITGGWYGAYSGFPFIMNNEVYEGLPDPVRAVIDETSREAVVQNASIVTSIEDQVCEDAGAAGVTVSTLSESAQAEMQPYADKYLDAWVTGHTTDSFDAQKFFDDYVAQVRASEQQSDYVPSVQKCAAK